METKLKKVEIRTEVDCDPDYSHLGYWTDDPPEGSVTSGKSFRVEDPCSCRGHYSYFVTAADPGEEGRDVCRSLYERGKGLAENEWHMIGIWAVATILVGPDGWRQEQEIRSGGLWGIESDTTWGYFKEVAREELHAVQGQLRSLGVDITDFEELAEKAMDQWENEVG